MEIWKYGKIIANFTTEHRGSLVNILNDPFPLLNHPDFSQINFRVISHTDAKVRKNSTETRRSGVRENKSARRFNFLLRAPK